MTLLTPEFLQTKKYSAKRWRAALGATPIQQGVVNPTDLKASVTGSSMIVSVAAGEAFVAANDPSNKGFYHVENDASITVTVGTAHATLPRLDQVYLQVNDSTDGGDASDVPTLLIAAGTATAAADLNNRNGAATLPTGSIRLADVLVPAAATSIPTVNVRDRRSWARGGTFYYIRTAGNYTTASTSIVTMDSTNMAPRMELSGLYPVRMTLAGVFSHTIATKAVLFTPIISGVTPAYTLGQFRIASAGVGQYHYLEYTFMPNAANAQYAWGWATDTGTATAFGNGSGGVDPPLVMTIEELLAPSANNT